MDMKLETTHKDKSVDSHYHITINIFTIAIENNDGRLLSIILSFDNGSNWFQE